MIALPAHLGPIPIPDEMIPQFLFACLVALGYVARWFQKVRAK